MIVIFRFDTRLEQTIGTPKVVYSIPMCPRGANLNEVRR
jgi:hypothetical protein